MALRALIVAGALSLGAILWRGRRSRRAGGGQTRDVFVELVALPATAPTSASSFASSSTSATIVVSPRSLDGLRFAVKDIFDVEGRVAGFGSPAWAATHAPAARTAPAIVALQSAGAVGVGMTHMDELAYGINGENAHYGTPKNPAAPGRIPGGSSSGSAVAVAAALHGVDFALGTDSGGSVRVPASYTGCYGFRPTHGAVSVAGVVPFAGSFDTVGWFARSPDVLAHVGRTLLPPPPPRADDPEIPEILGASELSKTCETPGVLPTRMMVLEDVLDLCDTHAQCTVAAACLSLAETFPPGTITRLDLGRHLLMACPALRAVQDADTTTGLDVLRNCFRLLMGAEVWSNVGGWYATHKSEVGAGTKERMDMASKIAPESLGMMHEARDEVRGAIALLLLDRDTVLILPTTPGPAPELHTDSAATEAWRRKTLQLTCISSMCGTPQVTIPMVYPGGDGPYGLSFIAGCGQDQMCLDAARAWGGAVAEAFPAIVAAEMSRPRDAGEGNDRAGAGTGVGAGANPRTSGSEYGPEPGEECKKKGNAAFKAGHFVEAAKLYTFALDRVGGTGVGANAWCATVLSNRAMTHLKLGAFAEAEDDCTAAVKLDARNVKAFLRRGAARSVSGNYLEAVLDYESALRLEPRNKDAKSEILRMKNILGDSQPIPDFDQ